MNLLFIVSWLDQIKRQWTSVHCQFDYIAGQISSFLTNRYGKSIEARSKSINNKLIPQVVLFVETIYHDLVCKLKVHHSTSETIFHFLESPSLPTNRGLKKSK